MTVTVMQVERGGLPENERGIGAGESAAGARVPGARVPGCGARMRGARVPGCGAGVPAIIRHDCPRSARTSGLSFRSTPRLHEGCSTIASVKRHVLLGLALVLAVTASAPAVIAQPVPLLPEPIVAALAQELSGESAKRQLELLSPSTHKYDLGARRGRPNAARAARELGRDAAHARAGQRERRRHGRPRRRRPGQERRRLRRQGRPRPHRARRRHARQRGLAGRRPVRCRRHPQLRTEPAQRLVGRRRHARVSRCSGWAVVS
jgi:hypothetical protein